MSPDVPRENLERWRARGARAIGGPYGGERTYLGHKPQLSVVKVKRYVPIDSLTPSTKLFSTPFPRRLRERININEAFDHNAQVIGEFERPISNIRALIIPLTDATGDNVDRDVPTFSGYVSSVTSILYFNLLTVDFSQGPFKFEDLTFNVAFQVWRGNLTVSSLYATASNFRKPGNGVGTDFVGFVLDKRVGVVNIPSTGATPGDTTASHGINVGTKTGGAPHWFAFPGEDGFTDEKIDGDAAVYTGFHMYFAPENKAGAEPEPSIAGEEAIIKVDVRDPAIPSNGRFPFALERAFDVVDE